MKKYSFLILALAAVLCACNNNGNEVKEPVVLRLNQQQQQMLQVTNDFSFDLLREVKAKENKANIVLSPLSASFALGMVMNGADGNTLKEMQTALGFNEEYAIEDINEYYRKLISNLPYLDKTNTLKIANSIWAQNGFPFYDSFIKTNKEWFSSKVENVDFTNKKTADKINRWAADNTNNLIKEVVSADEIADAVMVLANALYFKGIWKEKFNKDNTRPFDFTTARGNTIQTPMMQQTHSFKYAETEEGQLLEMDYKEEKYTMDILLPAKEQSLDKLTASMTSEKWQEWMEKMQYCQVRVRLPKLETRYEVELKEALKATGIVDAFTPAADFSKMSEQDLFINRVKQLCYLKIDEEGTEAAAVTVVGMKNSAVEYEEPKIYDFFVDRPYLMVIREKNYGTILFTAAIGDPG